LHHPHGHILVRRSRSVSLAVVMLVEVVGMIAQRARGTGCVSTASLNAAESVCACA
jgi:hypothetical protein